MVSVFREISSKTKSIKLHTQTAEATCCFCVYVHTEIRKISQPASETAVFHGYDSIQQLYFTTSEKSKKNPTLASC